MSTDQGPHAQPAAGPAIQAIAALQDQLRRGMYQFIRRMRRPVTRDEAAASVGISRKLAAFHLDKLVEAGVLRARYEAVGTNRTVGRTPKIYEPSTTDIQISIPPRQHGILADILIDAVLADENNIRSAAVAVAHQRGQHIGATERRRSRPGRLGTERALTLADNVLEQHGYEPTREATTCLRLRNCPFHPLATKSRELVCGLNHAFMTGILTGLNAPTVEAVLDPRPGECCVELRSKRTTPRRVPR